jgi:purine-nucleoside phosphorylase
MIHTDFINQQGDNALAHLTPSNVEESFIDPKPAYHPEVSLALKRSLIAAAATVHEGVYVGVRGPIYETLAELKMLKAFGADAIGMSSIPELTVAHAFKLPVAGISVITNKCCSGRQVSHAAVVQASREASPKLASGIMAFLEDRSWRKDLNGLEDSK